MRRGQISVEYLMIVGLLLLVLTPIAYLAQDQAQTTSDLRHAQSELKKLKNSIRLVDSLGHPSRQTILFEVPGRINGSEVNNQTLILYSSTGSDLFEEAGTCVEGLLPSTPGYHAITVRALQNGCVALNAESFFVDPPSTTIVLDKGFTTDYNFTVTNTVSLPLSVNATTYSSWADLDLVIGGRQSSYSMGGLSAGESRNLSTRFFGDSAGTYEGSIIFSGDDSQVNSTITLNVVEGVLDLLPENVYIPVHIGLYNQTTLTVNNTGDGTLYFTNLSVEEGVEEWADLNPGGSKESFLDLGNLTVGEHDYMVNVYGNQSGNHSFTITGQAFDGQEDNITVTASVYGTLPQRFYAVLEDLFNATSTSGALNDTNTSDDDYRTISETYHDYVQTIFFDDFEHATLNNWTEAGDLAWDATTSNPYTGSYSAESTGFGNPNDPEDSFMYTNYLNLSQYSSTYDNLSLTFAWYINSGVDSGEYLTLDLYDGSWHYDEETLQGNVDAEDAWHTVIYNVSQNLDSGAEEFRIQFESYLSHGTESVYVDDVLLRNIMPFRNLNATYSITGINTSYTNYNLTVEAKTSGENFTVTADGNVVGYVDSTIDKTLTYDATSIAGDGVVNVSFYDTNRVKDYSTDSLSIDFIELVGWSD